MSDNQGIEIPGEGSESSLAPDNNTAIVEKAKQKGWAPIDSWRGNPEDWVDAKEFLGREKLYSTIHELRKDISNIKNATQKDFQVIAEHFSKMREVEYKRALDNLKAQRREAMQDGDLDKADELETQMDEIKEARSQAKAAAPQATASTPDPLFEAWKQENDWFEKDIELQREAVGIGVGFANANPNVSQADVLKYVTEKIKKYNPDKFGEDQMDDDEPRQRSSVEAPSRRGTTGTPGRKGKISVGDLSTQQRDIMNTLIKRGVLNDAAAKNKRTPEQEYLAQLAEAHGL